MSLGRKLLSGFGAMLALVLLNSGGGLLVTHDLNNDLKQAANVTARKQYLAGEVNAATSEMAMPSGLARNALENFSSDSRNACSGRWRPLRVMYLIYTPWASPSKNQPLRRTCTRTVFGETLPG